VKEEAKDHYLSTLQRKKGPYIVNLLNLLEENNYIRVLEQLGGSFNNNHSLSVVAEDFQSGEEVARIHLEGKVSYRIITS
jgi:F0F1-type ATP synthase delta subunit